MEDSASNPAPRNRCIIYIDGFNFYFGLFKQRPEWRWLNLQSFFENLRLDDDVVKIRYFTAIVDEREQISRKRDRQKRFHKALSSLPKVEVVLGFFQDRERKCQASCKEKYKEPEEKKTDVNIAVAMIHDAIAGSADSMVVVSGDSDIQPAVAWVRQNHPKIKITVYVPALPEAYSSRRTDYYRQQLRIQCRFLPTQDISAHQFPNSVTLLDGKAVERPDEWT
jgi:hypothetical protein